MSAPQLISLSFKDRTLAMRFDQELDANSVPDLEDVNIGSSAPPNNPTENSIVIFFDTVYIGVAELIGASIISATYSGSWIRNKAGELAAAFNNQVANNSGNGVDNSAPVLLGLVGDEEFVHLYFNEVLAMNMVPAASSFGVNVANLAQSVMSIDQVSVHGTRASLTLDGWIKNGWSATALYTAPVVFPLQDPSGNLVASLASSAATVTTSRLAIPLMLSVYAADQLAAQLPASEVASYLAASSSDRRRWLAFASRDVNNAAKYQGRKWDPNQVHEFPRTSGNVFNVPLHAYPRYPAYPSIGDEVWDYDLQNNRAIVPLDVKLAVLRQANALAAGRGKRLNAQHDGLASQGIGSLNESYVGTAAGSAAPKLCNEAWELLKRYQLVSGQLL
jgi:hypothetical protein